MPGSATPAIKLKPLFWDKMPLAAMKASIFDPEKFAHAKPTDEEREEVSKAMADQFFIKPPKKATGGKGGNSAAVAKPKGMFPDQRQNNVEIAVCRGAKIPFDADGMASLAAGLAHPRTRPLSVNQVEHLSNACPEEDEKILILGATAEQLAAPQEKVARFFKVMIDGNAAVRLQAMLFVNDPAFDRMLNKLSARVRLALDACCQVRMSQELPKLMQRVLLLGNTLNAGTQRGNAKAIKLEKLPEQLEKVLCPTNPKFTLVHWLAERPEADEAALDKLTEELSSVQPLINSGGTDKLQEEFADLKIKFDRLEVVRGQMERAGQQDDELYGLIEEYLESYTKQMEETQFNITSLGDNVQMIAGYLAQNDDLTKIEDLLHPIAELIKKLRFAHEDNRERLEKARRSSVSEGSEKQIELDHAMPEELGPFVTNPVDFRGIRFRTAAPVAAPPPGSAHLPVLKQREEYTIVELSKLPEDVRNHLPPDALTKVKPRGVLSPSAPVTLPADRRDAAGIPQTAETFAWAYPLDGVSSYEADWTNLAVPAIALFALGGFVYFDREGAVVGLNSLAPGPGLFFDDNPVPLPKQTREALAERGRLQPPTLTFLRAIGVTGFCWLMPNEELPGSDPDECLWEHGAFAYTYETPSLDCFFAVTTKYSTTPPTAQTAFMVGPALLKWVTAAFEKGTPIDEIIANVQPPSLKVQIEKKLRQSANKSLSREELADFMYKKIRNRSFAQNPDDSDSD